MKTLFACVVALGLAGTAMTVSTPAAAADVGFSVHVGDHHRYDRHRYDRDWYRHHRYHGHRWNGWYWSGGRYWHNRHHDRYCVRWGWHHRERVCRSWGWRWRYYD